MTVISITIFYRKELLQISHFFVRLHESRRSLNLTKKRNLLYSVCAIVSSAYIFHDEIFIVSKIYFSFSLFLSQKEYGIKDVKILLKAIRNF